MRELLLGRSSDECWLWTGSLDRHGYGRGYYKGKTTRLMHRAMYDLVVGPIPPGLELDHLCRTPRCVNPAHLEPVTPEENARRAAMVPKGVAITNAAKTHCDAGHRFDVANTYWRGNGRRGCRSCNRAAVARYQKRKAGAA